MTLTQLEYAVALDEHGHFGRAAEACLVTQPTLSRQLQKLEEDLGLRLFDRAQPQMQAVLPARLRPSVPGRLIETRGQGE